MNHTALVAVLLAGLWIVNHFHRNSHSPLPQLARNPPAIATTLDDAAGAPRLVLEPLAR